MNTEWIGFHLGEAKEQIDSTLQRLTDPEYGEVEFQIDVKHMLHHIHTANNSRNVAETAAISSEEFLSHQRPPEDMEWE
jgi:hypothetical protein